VIYTTGVRRVLAVFAVGIGALAPACSEGPDEARPPVRACATTLWYQPTIGGAEVEIVGSWNGFARPGLPMVRQSGGWRAAKLDLPPGVHRYAFVEAGAWNADPAVPTRVFETLGGSLREITERTVPSCEGPSVRVEATSAAPGSAATIDLEYTSGAREPSPLDDASVRVTRRSGEAVPFEVVEHRVAEGRIRLRLSELPRGKHTFVVRVADRRSRAAGEVLATVWSEPTLFDWRDGTIYQVVVDRFRSERGALTSPEPLSGRAGGTLRGVLDALRSGEIEALGARVLWLSPLYPNPAGFFPGGAGETYSSYHGYWPIAATGVESTQGTEEDLDTLVREAHARGIRVVFDVVPNHVHEQHPDVREHPEWFRTIDQTCLCGTPGCPWDTYIETCLFAPYMPDVRWENDAAARRMTDGVLYWIDRFDGDGVRIDAVPMMPRAATWRIADALRSRFQHAGNPLLVLGENFVAGSNQFERLRFYMGPFGLDSQFHFPLMWSVRDAIAVERAPMAVVDETIRRGETEWQGSGSVMTTFIGNHDIPRFSTVAAGDRWPDGFTPMPQPQDPVVYEKQKLAFAAAFFAPGVPVIYYGDEIGLAGGGDPDTRRVMPQDDELLPAQRSLRDYVKALANVRGCSSALRRGTYVPLAAGAEHVAWLRETEDDRAIVVLTRRANGPITIPLPSRISGDYVDVTHQSVSTLSTELTLSPAAPFSAFVYVPVTSACANSKR
jgi:glycosidase